MFKHIIISHKATTQLHLLKYFTGTASPKTDITVYISLLVQYIGGNMQVKQVLDIM